MIAVAAGDEENPIVTKKGLWIAGTFCSSNQDAYKGNPSYKGTVAGGTIGGGDLYLRENSLVGIAYSRMNSDFKFKGSSTGDKLSAESDIISLYGQQQFGSDFILQEIFSASNSKINTKDKSGLIAIKQLAVNIQAKFTALRVMSVINSLLLIVYNA